MNKLVLSKINKVVLSKMNKVVFLINPKLLKKIIKIHILQIKLQRDGIKICQKVMKKWYKPLYHTSKIHSFYIMIKNIHNHSSSQYIKGNIAKKNLKITKIR